MADLQMESYMANESGQENRGKLFVGGLSWETTSDNLRAYMSRYGEVVDCSVKMDIATGRSRGFGFVTFRTGEEADVVLRSRPHMLDGKLIDPKRAVGITKTGVPVTKKIFVGGVRSETPDDLLKDYFSQFGSVHSIDFPIDHASNKRRGFCFLEFEEPEAAEKAMEQNFHAVANQTVEVKPAYTKEQQQAMQARGMWPPPSTNKTGNSQMNNEQSNEISAQYALAALLGGAQNTGGINSSMQLPSSSSGQANPSDVNQLQMAAAFYQTYLQYMMAISAASVSLAGNTVNPSTQGTPPPTTNNQQIPSENYASGSKSPTSKTLERSHSPQPPLASKSTSRNFQRDDRDVRNSPSPQNSPRERSSSNKRSPRHRPYNRDERRHSRRDSPDRYPRYRRRESPASRYESYSHRR